MRQTTPLTIEHVVVASERPYEQVIAALEARLGPLQDWAALGQQATAAHASWEQFSQVVAEHIGASGLTLFYQVEHSFLLRLRGNSSRASQYTIGNPLLANQMTQYLPEAGLYAPLKLIVYLTKTAGPSWPTTASSRCWPSTSVRRSPRLPGW
jgi:uncharacterized protein (DUF302 family)